VSCLYSIVQKEKPHTSVNTVLIGGNSPTATQRYLTYIQVKMKLHN